MTQYIDKSAVVAEITDEDVCLHYIDVENWHDTLADLSRSRFKYYIQVQPLEL